MKNIFKSERGVALYLVLWVMALLAVMAGEFCHAVRTEVNITRNFKEETEAYYIAAAGVSRAIGDLVAGEFVLRPARSAGSEEEPEDARWRLSAAMPAVSFGNGQFLVVRENESGKVNLNRARRSLLKMMLNGFEINEADRDIIVDSIMDWRDKDDNHRLNGAEDDYYMSLPRPYHCKDGDFTTTEELLLVRGVTPELFYGGLKEMVSVHQDKEMGLEGSDSRRREEADYNRININAASLRMLRSLPGMTENTALAVMEYREKKDFRSLTEVFPVVGSDIYGSISPYLTLQPSPYYTIRSTGMINESRTRQGVQAMVKIDRRLDRGYEVIQWIDGLEYR